MYHSILIRLISLLYLHVILVSQPVQALDCNATLPTTPQTAYPNHTQIYNIFSHLVGTDANYALFFDHVLDDVNWTVEGTHALAGQYNNKTVLQGALARISDTGSKEAPLVLSIVNIIGGGGEEWSVQELQVLGVCRNGLKFDNRYAWATRWNKDGVIVEVRAYLDSLLVNTAIDLNEAGLFAYDDLRTDITPWVTLPVAVLVEASGLENETRS